MSNALDLYSKVEDLLGVNDVTPKLYTHYFSTLKDLKFKRLLDVGCGAGSFLAQVQHNFLHLKVMGIDLSPRMVEQTQSKGIEAHCIELCKVDSKFDVITAVFDMVNYLDAKELKRFMRCIEERLEEGGTFLCDINSLYAFKEIAVGSYICDDNTRFVTVDSEFEDNEYYSEFTLFEKEGNLFKKSQGSILQYYHRVDALKKLTKMKLVSKASIAVYGSEVEKFYLVFKK
ncbi:MAG TPA: class I SAM-dependent methyltransferase [Campylobacterales bacterium]|nr:class I SAM-dependent methyltransferase [Campylobacterales bacterium]HIP41619.1 class I SAM-dependent methyltransferase [Campylobacterales bacterium]